MTIANADSYHADYQLFAGPTFASLLADGMQASITGWSAPTTGKPSGWTAITDRTHWAGGLRTRLHGATIAFEAELSGENYDVDYLALGLAVCMWRRDYTPAGGWEAWAIEYIGELVALDDETDYRNGKTWRRGVTGMNHALQRINAPPLALGALDVTTGASVAAWNDDVLPDPALEADNEYIGEVASVGPQNIADGKLNTVFISRTAPNTTEERPETIEDGYVRVSEVFFAPAAGWPQSACWWIEVHNCRTKHRPDDPDQTFYLVAGQDYDAINDRYDTVEFAGGWREALADGEFGVVCGNRALFELYSGGAPDAKFVIDMGLYNQNFTLHPSDGFVSITDLAHTAGEPKQTIIWAPAGAARKAQTDPATGAWWYGPAPTYGPVATFDSDGLAAGYSVRRTLENLLGTPTGDPAWFSAVRFPTPGGHTTKVSPIALLVHLPENTCHLTQSVDAGTTQITLDNYVGWFEDGGNGIIESDPFTYTSRTANGLQGVTWDEAGSHAHQAGARCYPYAYVDFQGAMTWSQQTGYPLSDFYLLRRRQPGILEGRVYFSFLPTARQYEDESGWQDYSWQFAWANNHTELKQRFVFADAQNAKPFYWVSSVLIVIDKMTDGGRAKLNEIWARVAQLQNTNIIATPSGETPDTYPSVASSRSFDLVKWLLTTYAGMAAADLTDQSYSYTHRIGEHRLAVVPLTRILDDLARQTGCLVYYAPDGKLYWLDDPWWPYRSAFSRAQTWTNQNLVGALQFSAQPTDVDYVVVNAIALETEPPTPIRVTYPPPVGGGLEPPAGSQSQELSGFAVASETDARLLAEAEWMRANRLGNAAATMKGVHNVRPGQVVSITADYGQGASVAWDWQITEVSTQRTLQAGQRALTQNLSFRLWNKGAVTA